MNLIKHPVSWGFMVGFMALLGGCTNVTTQDYSATAKTTYTWIVRYSTNPNRTQERLEYFASRSLVNRNGEKPTEAVSGPDDRELWWPAIPPKPTLDEIEQRQKPAEQRSNAELLQDVDYTLTFRNEQGQSVTLPTNYDVYREVVKAYPDRIPLTLTLGPNDQSVEKAELTSEP